MLAFAIAAAALHIAPERSGSGDGSSWENAGALADLPAFVAKAEGRPIWLRADAGPYRTGLVQLAAGGTKDKPVEIQGVDVRGRPAKAELAGERSSPYRPDGEPGGEVFRLNAGADHLRFSNLAFRDQGLAMRIAADVRDLTIEDVDARNVRRFLDTAASGKGATASVEGLVVRRVEVTGYSKGAIRLRYDTRKVLIEDVVGDSERQDRDNFAMGVHLGDTVHDVVLRRVTMRNNQDSLHDYWNGDGFASERGTYDIRFEDTVASGNTDGGYDLKTRDVVLVRAVAEDNKRNFRLWQGGKLTEVVSREPLKRGGTGASAHFAFAGGGGDYVITRPTIEARPGMTLFLFETKGAARVKVVGADVPETARKVLTAKDTPAPEIDFEAGGKRR